MRILSLFLVSLMAVAGCNNNQRDSSQYPIEIVCTTGQVADMLRNIGGEHIRVRTLMGPEVDPHLFEPALDTQRVLHEADAIFYNGLHLEGRMAEVLEGMGDRKPTFAVTAELEHSSPDKLLRPAEFEGAFDPHVWFDASLWAECARYAAEKLAEVDPAHAQEYRSNAAAYIKQLNDLHAWTKAQLGEIPKQQRVLVTAHDAFGYFGRAYDVEVHGLQGISTRDEADVKEASRLVDLLVDRKVRAVFIETSVPERNIQSLIENSARRGHTVEIGGQLYSDAMGPEGMEEGTYAGMLRYNVKTIVEALK